MKDSAFTSPTPALRAVSRTRAPRAPLSARRGAPHAMKRAQPRMVKAPLAPGAEREIGAAPVRGGALRWVVTVCGAPCEATRALVEAAVRERGGQHADTWRRLGEGAHELTVRARGEEEDALRAALHGAGAASGCDVVLQTEAAVRAGKALAVFDLDSTLIAEETIDELAAEAGASDRVRDLTSRAMAGDLAFRDALRERVAVLEGLPLDALVRVRDRATLTLGARDVVRVLRRSGCVTAVVSGGFHFLADHVRDTLGLDYAFANTLEVADDGATLTGRTVGDVVDAEFKANALSELARKHGIPDERVLAVGDGSNDVIMLQRAGLGVAFNAKPKVQRAAKARVNQPSLANVLYLLGLDDEQIRRLAEGGQ